MRVLIGVTDEAGGADLADFYGWLRDTRGVTRVSELKMQSERPSGAMSAGDVIVLTTSAVSALSATVQAFAAWRSSRPSAPSLTIRVDGAGTVIVSTGSAQELALLARIANLPGAVPGVAEAAASEVAAEGVSCEGVS